MSWLLLLHFNKVMPLTECGPVIIDISYVHHNLNLSRVAWRPFVPADNSDVVLVSGFTVQCHGCLYFTRRHIDGKPVIEKIFVLTVLQCSVVPFFFFFFFFWDQGIPEAPLIYLVYKKETEDRQSVSVSKISRDCKKPLLTSWSLLLTWGCKWYRRLCLRPYQPPFKKEEWLLYKTLYTWAQKTDLQ